MENTTIESAKDSQNSFEKHITFFEKQKLTNRNSKEKFEFAINLMNALESILKDRMLKLKNENVQKFINNKIEVFLEDWYLQLSNNRKTVEIIDSYNYNLFVFANVVEKIDSTNYLQSIKQIVKLSPDAIIDDAPVNNKHSAVIGDVISGSASFQTFIMLREKLIDSRNKKNDIGLDKALAKSFSNLISHQFLILKERFHENYFNLDIEDLYKKDTSEIIDSISKFDFNATLETLFRLQNSTEYFEWTFLLKWDKCKNYNAVKISNLIFTISSLLQNIDDVEVNLDDWGIGSRWAKLRVKIYAEKAKVEILDSLTRLRQLLQSHRNKTSLEEIQKSGAERDKIRTETELAKIELLLKKGNAETTQKLENIAKFQDIQLKDEQIETERLKNLQLRLEITNKAAEMLSKGILEQDGHFQLEINRILFSSSEDSIVKIPEISNIPEIEGRERKKRSTNNSDENDDDLRVQASIE